MTKITSDRSLQDGHAKLFLFPKFSAGQGLRHRWRACNQGQHATNSLPITFTKNAKLPWKFCPDEVPNMNSFFFGDVKSSDAIFFKVERKRPTNFFHINDPVLVQKFWTYVYRKEYFETMSHQCLL